LDDCAGIEHSNARKTPRCFAGLNSCRGTALEGGFRLPAIIRWPGKVPASKVENGIVSALD
jgi:hypothetical protein